MSLTHDSEPQATQPATCHAADDSDTDNEKEEPRPVAWGRLFPLSPEFETIELIKDACLLGRHPECDVIFEDPIISNRHCALTRSAPTGISQPTAQEFAVFLEDKSSNGTYVNGVRLGKGNKVVLKHGDEISLTLKKKSSPNFLFHDCINTPQVSVANEQFKEKYNLMRVLGTGACGEVWLAVNKITGHRFAVKMIQKKRFSSISQVALGDKQLMQEVEILRKLDHPNIVTVVEVFDSPETFVIVLELAQGGELFDLIVTKGRFIDTDAKFFFRQLFLAVQYLHSQGVTHRDLKPENILLSCFTVDAIIKVTDFGLAKLVGPTTFMKTMCGTPSYQAPEVLLAGMGQAAPDGYSSAVDVWSLGVILYICLFGYPPFAEDVGWHSFSLHDQIVKGIFDFPSDIHVESQAKHLIKRMLTVDPAKRITIEEALAHPWLQDANIADRIVELLDDARSSKAKLAHAIAEGAALHAGSKRPAESAQSGDSKRAKLVQ